MTRVITRIHEVAVGHYLIRQIQIIYCYKTQRKYFQEKNGYGSRGDCEVKFLLLFVWDKGYIGHD